MNENSKTGAIYTPDLSWLSPQPSGLVIFTTPEACGLSGNAVGSHNKSYVLVVALPPYTTEAQRFEYHRQGMPLLSETRSKLHLFKAAAANLTYRPGQYHEAIEIGSDNLAHAAAFLSPISRLLLHPPFLSLRDVAVHNELEVLVSIGSEAVQHSAVFQVPKERADSMFYAMQRVAPRP
ncbi:hypothetical protein HYU40_04265 [Candidatus Woesearchaeota archaeon]|nr:hypothetical protein [Candidatus Woesearchaeota archaeon]